jgi:hypothetical protein
VRSRSAYAFAGLVIGAAVNFLINLLSAAIQQQPLGAQLTSQSSVAWLIIFIVVGLLVGYWLGGKVDVPAEVTTLITVPDHLSTTTITRLRALLSYSKLRGKGVHLSDILLIGSHIDIDSRD